MALKLSGKVLDYREETVTPQGRESFVSRELVIGTEDYRKEYVRLGREFPLDSVPARDSEVTLLLWASAYVNKAGQARVQYTAHGIEATAGRRAVSAA